jgi:hypothetical protein
MPLKKCSDKGKSRWKWGNQGHCYTGPGAKKKAIKQGIAVEGPEKFAQIASTFEESATIDEVAEAMVELGYGAVDVLATTARLK